MLISRRRRGCFPGVVNGMDYITSAIRGSKGASNREVRQAPRRPFSACSELVTIAGRIPCEGGSLWGLIMPAAELVKYLIATETRMLQELYLKICLICMMVILATAVETTYEGRSEKRLLAEGLLKSDLTNLTNLIARRTVFETSSHPSVGLAYSIFSMGHSGNNIFLTENIPFSLYHKERLYHLDYYMISHIDPGQMKGLLNLDPSINFVNPYTVVCCLVGWGWRWEGGGRVSG